MLPKAGSVFAVISPVAGGHYVFNVTCDRGLFYEVSGTAGDYTLTYVDEPGPF
jgi:hypothetical protein